MGVQITGSGISTEKLLLDFSESWNGYHMQVSGNSNGAASDARGQSSQEQTAINQLFPSIGGALAALAFDATSGITTHLYASIAGNSSLSGQVGNGNYGIPLYQKFSLASSVPAAFQTHPFRRYRIDYLVRGSVGPNAAADVACGISGNNPTGMVTGGAADPFVAWVSRSALNGGQWTARSRLTFGGAFVDGPSSGLPFIPVPDRWTQLSIMYDEGIVPRIRWLANGAEIHQIAGDANMPAATIYFPAKAMGNNAGGSVCRYAPSRLRVWEIG